MVSGPSFFIAENEFDRVPVTQKYAFSTSWSNDSQYILKSVDVSLFQRRISEEGVR